MSAWTRRCSTRFDKRALSCRIGSETTTKCVPHSGLGGRTPASVRVPLCSPASRPLRVAFSDGLRLALTQASPDGNGLVGQDGETAMNQTEKHRQDGPYGNRELYF